MSEHVTYRPSWAGSRAVERLGGRAAQDRQQGIVFGTQQARGALRVADHCGVSWSRHRHQADDGRDLGLPSRLPVPACVEVRLDVRTCPSRFTAPLAFSGGLGIGSSISADHGYRHQRLRGAPARPDRGAVDPGDHAADRPAQGDAGGEMHAAGKVCPSLSTPDSLLSRRPSPRSRNRLADLKPPSRGPWPRLARWPAARTSL